MKFRRLERAPLSEVVAAEIEEAIAAQEFAFESRLPSEQQLADQFGVSRNVVREAFKLLRERGLISIQAGSGAQVLKPSGDVTSAALGRYLRLSGESRSIEHLYQVRRLLEGEAARLAAEHADGGDVSELGACLERMAESVNSVDDWTNADLAFHLAVARATHNPLFNVLLQPLVDQLRTVITEGFLESGAAERGYEAHREVYRSIQAKDSERAYAAIIDHLHDSEERLLRLHSHTGDRAPEESQESP